MNNLHHTQVARAHTDGNQDEIFSFVRKHVITYIAGTGLSYSPKNRERFVRKVRTYYEEWLRNPLDLTYGQDPTGETAVKNIMAKLATY